MALVDELHPLSVNPMLHPLSAKPPMLHPLSTKSRWLVTSLCWSHPYAGHIIMLVTQT